jgi:hypothetical protein
MDRTHKIARLDCWRKGDKDGEVLETRMQSTDPERSFIGCDGDCEQVYLI